MNLTIINDKLEDLEAKLKDELNRGFPLNWKAFIQIENSGAPDNPSYKKVVDLLLHFDLFSLEQDGNIVLRFPDSTSSQSIANPRHYSLGNVEIGGNPLFFTRDRDAIEYIKAGEEVNYLVKGYQAQRIKIIKPKE